MTEIKRGDFARVMSQYLFDYPDLAQKIAASQPGCQHRDVPALVAEYNRFKGQSTGK